MKPLRLLFTLFVFSTCVFAADSPFSGTWKLNPAKSTLPPPPPQSDVAVVKVDGDSINFSEEITDEKGQSTKVAADAKFDGKEYPLTGDPEADSISYHKVNANTLVGTAKKSGKLSEKMTIVVSKDGKVTSVHFTTYPAGKKPMKGVAVYDKQ
jgi:hypothetical protein